MATLTISPHDGVYSVSSDPEEVPEVGKLSIVVPTGPPVGCLICLDNDLEGARPYVLTSNRDFDLKGKARGTIWGYDVLAPTATCRTVNKRNAAHPIQVISSR
jgi:hypothetical protein